MSRWLGIVLLMGFAAVTRRDARGASTNCADINDNGFVNVADPVCLLRWLFSGGPPLPCARAAGACGDLNRDEAVDLEDAVDLLGWLFLGAFELVCPPSCEDEAPQIGGFTLLGCNARGYPEYTHDLTGIIFVHLPGGKFNMGSPADERGRWDDEGPVHEVQLSPFLIAKYEVTQAQWKLVMGTNPSRFQGAEVPPGVNGDQLPVEQVSWHDTQQFKAKTGLRLPTEAQREYAGRAGTQTAFSFSSGEGCADWDCGGCDEWNSFMWYCGNSGFRTHEVGTKQANPFGLHDVHGNVWEWCQDGYEYGFYSTPEAAGPDPLSKSVSGGVVARGGSGWDFAWSCRCAIRFRFEATTRFGSIGFRPAVWPLP